MSCHCFFLSPSLSFLLPYSASLSIVLSLPSLAPSLPFPLPPSFLSLPPSFSPSLIPHLTYSLLISLAYSPSPPLPSPSSLTLHLTHPLPPSLTPHLPYSLPTFLTPHLSHSLSTSLTHSPPPLLTPHCPYSPLTSLTPHRPYSPLTSLTPHLTHSPPHLLTLYLPSPPSIPSQSLLDSSSSGNGAPPPPPGFTAKGKDSSGPSTLSNSVNHSLWANATGQGRPKYSTCVITLAPVQYRVILHGTRIGQCCCTNLNWIVSTCTLHAINL